MAIVHPDYTMLANRISVSSLHKTTSDDIAVVAETLHKFVDNCGRKAQLLDDFTYSVIVKNRDLINKRLDYTRDFNYDFFGFKTLERAYLLRVKDKKIAERPQHLLMRVSIGIHGEDLDSAFENRLHDCCRAPLHDRTAGSLVAHSLGSERPVSLTDQE